MQLEIVDDPTDPRLADYVGLTDPQIRRRLETSPFFIAEGVEVVKRLIASDIRRRSIVIAPNRLDAMRESLEHAHCPIYIAERQIMSRIVGFDLHRGVIASGLRPEPVTLTDVLSRPSRSEIRHHIAVLHAVSDHENVGAIVRSARAFDLDALVLDPTSADPFYRRSVRVSMGEIFHLPIVRMSVDTLISEVGRHEGTSVALTPKTDAVPLDDLRPQPGPLALILGSEGFGLPDSILQAVDVCSRIPISSEVDSLNVGHAAAVAFALVARL